MSNKELTAAEKKIADSFKAEWIGGIKSVTIKVGGKVIKEIKRH